MLTFYTVMRFLGVDFPKTLDAMKRVALPLYLTAFFVYALTFPIRGLRWKRLLNNVGLDAKVSVLSETILLSWFVNCVAPAKLGDLYRGYLMRRNERFPLTTTLATIFAERIIDSAALFIILSVGLILSASKIAPGLEGKIILIAGTFVAVLLLMLAVMHWHGRRVIRFFPAQLHDIYDRFSSGAFASFQKLPWIAVLTFLAWACEYGRLFIVTRAMGVDIAPASVMVVLSGAALLLTVPTPGGIGVVEVGLASLLILFGVNNDVALAVALLDRVISYWALIATGLPLYIFSKRTR
jgi:uncharacterized protein (TIRG00374 family)